MNSLPEGKTSVPAILITSGKGNNYLTENQKRIENHKKIMAHLEAITKLLDVARTKQEQ